MATLYTARSIIVILAADQSTANAQAVLVDPAGGAGTFHAGLSPTGALPITNYWCNWAMTPAQDTDMRGRLSALVNTGRVQIFDALTTTTAQVLTVTGLQPVTIKFP